MQYPVIHNLRRLLELRLAWALMLATACLLLIANIYFQLPPTSAEEPPGVPVLMYHKVNPHRSEGGLGLRVHPRDFKWQMAYLAERGYTAISPDQLWDHLEFGESLPPRPVLITFDDGYRDNYTWAYPILREYGHTAIIFMVAGAVGKTNYFDAATQPVNQMLSWDEIRELKAGGLTIGAHTLDHPRLTNVSPDRLAQEVGDSRENLESELGEPVYYFCYPYGDFNGEVEQAVFDAGYRLAFTTIQGRVEAGDNHFTLKRLRVTGKTRDHEFKALLE